MMTDFVDAICDVFHDHWIDHETHDTAAAAQAIIDLIIARIPPLVWEGKADDCYMNCEIQSQNYELIVTDTLERSCDYTWEARFSEGSKTGVILGCDTLEAAKAAANAHHVAQLCKGMGIE